MMREGDLNGNVGFFEVFCKMEVETRERRVLFIVTEVEGLFVTFDTGASDS